MSAEPSVLCGFPSRIANLGFSEAVERSEPIRQGVNTFRGHITYKAVAESQGREDRDLRALL